MKKVCLILLLSQVILSLLLVGCSSKPDDSTTKDLAMGYLKGGTFGNANISKDMIKVLKSFEQEGAPVMTFQVGGMICDMPVLKTEQGWIARGLNCNGAIGNIRTATSSKDAILKELAKEVTNFYKQPHTPEDGLLQKDLRLYDNSLIFSITMIEVPTAIDYDQTKKQQLKETMISRAKKGVCKVQDTREAFDLGIDFVYDFYAADDSMIESVVIGKKDCI